MARGALSKPSAGFSRAGRKSAKKFFPPGNKAHGRGVIVSTGEETAGNKARRILRHAFPEARGKAP